MNNATSSVTSSFLETLIGIIAALVAAKNPKYQPLIQVAATAAQGEIDAVVGGADLTPHSPVAVAATIGSDSPTGGI